ncbi:MAG: hypothetical protein HYS13_12005 [Planctomycetia bacterium]|nr:hypothetical protein [Planctomycetia bacterium]
MFAVGALDAYFSDAYSDVVAAAVISKSRHHAMNLPGFVYEIKFPVGAILTPYARNPNWRWRMASRRMMERENVLSLGAIRTLFNKFFRKGHKFFGDVFDSWITHRAAKKRVFGITGNAYRALNAAGKTAARGDAIDAMEDRYAMIFQRRHDCIHNCDRPRTAPQPLEIAATVLKVIGDVEFLVSRCNEHIDREFRQFLVDSGCPAAIIAQVGY